MELIELKGHTEGPWYYEDGSVVYYRDVNGDTTRFVLIDWAPFESDGKLFAAAPSLLAIAEHQHKLLASLGREFASQAIWKQHGIQPPAAAEGRDGEQ